MARVSTYLNFLRSTEEAFTFYKGVFATEFSMPIARFGDMPAQPGQPPLPDADKFSGRQSRYGVAGDVLGRIFRQSGGPIRDSLDVQLRQ